MIRNRRNGAGRGIGMPGGIRRNQNNGSCLFGGIGFGRGGGRGLGRGRKY